jgi:glycosyltransferase involved in cell wall biosynthesis
MSRDNKTLVILIPGFPKDLDDTTCLPAQQIFVRKLKELNPDLNIVVLSFQYPYHTQPYRLFGVEVIPFSIRTKKGIAKWFMRQKIWKALNQVRDQNDLIGILSFWCSECAAVGKRFAHLNNLRHFCWVMGQDARESNRYVSKIKPEPAELIALSDSLQNEFERNHNVRPSHVIPAGIDTRLFSLTQVNRDIDLLAAGSLIPLKQFDIFLTLIATSLKQNPHLKAALIGEGPEKRRLQQRANELGIAPNIIFTGELPHHETLKWMQRANIFIHPSSYEGFSGVCLEALHAGCQVISFCKAMNTPIDHWHIVTYENEMNNKTRELLDEKSLSHHCVTPYTIEGTVRKILGLYLNSISQL